ncbi:MAG TPA: hypothetical protein VJZ78_04595 [Anaerolineales bacterium]|nr:hypothetical protein [Anaerolineales bacterium]
MAYTDIMKRAEESVDWALDALDEMIVKEENAKYNFKLSKLLRSRKR